MAGAVLGGLAVVLGAFGAHGLRARVSPEMLQVFETGVRYHFYHALALLGVGLLAAQAGSTPGAPAAGALLAAAWCFLAGIAVFSGSLYAMTLTGARWLGAITPLGGIAFIAGWVMLALAAWRRT